MWSVFDLKYDDMEDVCSRCSKVLPLALAVYQDGLPPHYVHAVHLAKVSQYHHNVGPLSYLHFNFYWLFIFLYLSLCHVVIMLSVVPGCSMAIIVSISLSINIASISTNGVDLSLVQSVGRSVGQSVYLFVRKVYCGKIAGWIQVPFGMVSWVSWDGCRRWRWWSSKGKGQFWGEFGASHCN